MTSFTSRLSAVMIVAAATAAACASSSPPPKIAPAPAPSDKVALTEASPARPPAPLPTTLLPGIGMSAPGKKGSDVDEEDEITGPPPACSKDEDCWSKSCCPARAPEECVHASRARKCAIVDVTCKPSPMHYTCFCDSGACRGRLAPP